MTFPEGWRIPQPYHHMMLGNPRRMAAFRHAISSQIKPGHVVLEAGAGSGILSALAARAGARKVYAVERDPEMVKIALNTVALNNLRDVVEVISAQAENFDPPEVPDVLICEMLHVGLVNEQQVPVMRKLLDRLSTEGLITIPFAVVNAVQLLEVDFNYEGLEIPLIRSSHPYVEDPRLTGVSEPVTYWVCSMRNPENAVDALVPLQAARDGRVNAVGLITKAVMTEDFSHPDNDWYLFQLQIPLPVRDMKAGETRWLRLSYEAGCPLGALNVGWSDAPVHGS